MYYLSIITVTYNNLEGLKNTAKSVLPLTKNCEWIIIDGDSNDGTKSFLESLPKQDNIKYISEKDNGIYDAMNKGIKLSQGRYLNFMNSGDSFNREVFLEIISKEPQHADMILYDCNVIDENGNEGYTRQFPKSIDEIKNWACVQHQSTLISRVVFDKLGLYSMSYNYLSDYEHSLKAYLSKEISFSLNPDIKLSVFQLGGVSSNFRMAPKLANESSKIRKHLLGMGDKRVHLIAYIKYVISFLPYHKNFITILRKVLFSKR